MKKKTIRIILLNITVFSVLILPALAQAISGSPGSATLNPLGGTTTLSGLILNILKVAIQIAIPVTALAIVYIGFWFVTANGVPAEIKKAKDALMYTLIGFAVLLGASAIVDIIQNTVKGIAS